MFLASDITAMVAYTDKVVYLNDGEIVDIRRDRYDILDREERKLDKRVDQITGRLGSIEKGDFACHMEKEIFEQPESIARALSGRLDIDNATAKLGGLNLERRRLSTIGRVKVMAAGTSWHAGLVGSQLLEQVARIPAQSELASEVRYRNPVVEKDSLWFTVSQSGETADSLYAMREISARAPPSWASAMSSAPP